MYTIAIKGQVRPNGTVQNLVADFSHNKDKDYRKFNVIVDVDCVDENGNVVGTYSDIRGVEFLSSDTESFSNMVDAAINAGRVANAKFTPGVLTTFIKSGVHPTILTDVAWKENVDKAIELAVKAAA